MADGKGHLFNEQSKHEVFRGSHSILAPFEVQIEHRLKRRWKVPHITYPVPAHWQPEVANADPFELIAEGEWGWERGERFSGEALLARGRRGMLDGIRGGSDPGGLLDNFLRLAHEDLNVGELPARVIKQVVTFVKKWGPLWLCRTQEHQGKVMAKSKTGVGATATADGLMKQGYQVLAPTFRPSIEPGIRWWGHWKILPRRAIIARRSGA